MMQTLYSFHAVWQNARRALCLLLLLLGVCVQAKATHIVGGEIELIYQGTGNNYCIGLVMYFDGVNGNPGALDNQITVHAYDKATNTLVQSFQLPLVSNTLVNYTNPACANGNLVTRRLYYRLCVNLDPNRYSAAQGYYFVHERCCRNNVIQNIVNPGAAAQAFYMEFPPLLRNGVRFINSTPSLFPPLSDYACLNKPFYFNFGGTDVDGDSLVYSLITPLNGFATTATPVPGPSPGPYPSVTFLPGFSVNNMIQGNPALRIDPTGLVTVRPSRTGLFVFAVRCQEFRNGVRIGEVRRDFQMLVLDCPVFSPPVANVTFNGQPYVPGTELSFQVGQVNSCLRISVTDPEANTSLQVRTRVVAGGLSSADFNVTPLTGTVINPGQTAVYELCLRDCPTQAAYNRLSRVQILVGDNSCAVPLWDTVEVAVRVVAPPNNVPVTSTSLTAYDPATKTYTASLEVGQVLNFDAIGTDADLTDNLRLFAEAANFTFASSGMQFAERTGTSPVRSSFRWAPSCTNLGTDEQRLYRLKFVTADSWRCGSKSRDSVWVNITLRRPTFTNVPPRVQIPALTRFDAANRTFFDTVEVGSNYGFEVIATDADIDSMRLYATGVGFNLPDVRMNFPARGGIREIRTRFQWPTDCDLLDVPNNVWLRTFQLFFIANDYNGCDQLTYDTVRVRLTLRYTPQANVRPDVTLTGADFDPAIRMHRKAMTVGEEVRLIISVTDADADTVELVARGRGFDMAGLGMEFVNRTARAPFDAPFRWLTDCIALPDGADSREYIVDFIASDINRCDLRTRDTVSILFSVLDIAQIEIKPFPNAFSPNGDGFSERYFIAGLPVDNCKDSFTGIEIYNRWGELVFSSDRRDFAWDGRNFPPGTYNYLVKYRNSQYKGTVLLVKEGQ